MNTVQLVGKVASPIRLQEFTASGGGSPHAKASFLIAVRRVGGRRTEGPRNADMIRVETWGTSSSSTTRARASP